MIQIMMHEVMTVLYCGNAIVPDHSFQIIAFYVLNLSVKCAW